MLRLANAGENLAAARIERHVHAAEDQGGLLTVDKLGRIEVVRIAGFELGLRKQLTANLINAIAGGLLGIQRLHNQRIFLGTDRDGIIEAAGHQFRIRVRLSQT